MPMTKYKHFICYQGFKIQKVVIRSHESKKNGQYNVQNKKDKQWFTQFYTEK